MSRSPLRRLFRRHTTSASPVPDAASSPSGPASARPGAAAPRPGSQDFTAASRDALAEALLAAGPGRPTLCEGWNTEHLAAHVKLRESSPLATGLLLPPLAGRLERRTQGEGDAHAEPASYQALVQEVARGPQTPGPLRGLAGTWAGSAPVRRAAQAANLLEFFVHTEDVRRAQDRWAPRRLADDYADALWEELRRRARLMYRGFQHEGRPVGVRLVRVRSTRDGDAGRLELQAASGEPTLTVRGPAGELALHAFGRRDHALVLTDLD